MLNFWLTVIRSSTPVLIAKTACSYLESMACPDAINCSVYIFPLVGMHGDNYKIWRARRGSGVQWVAIQHMLLASLYLG